MTIERIPNQQDLSWFIDMYNGGKLSWQSQQEW